MASQGSARLLKDVMKRDVEAVTPFSSVQAAAQKMKSLNVGAIPVCDGSRLRGMLTDRDIVVRVIAERRDVISANAADAMSTDLVYCFEDQRVDEAARIMGEKLIRRLPILSRDKQLVGIVSLGDVAVKTDAAGQTLKDVSEPAQGSLRTVMIFLAGAALGAVAALLLTPKTGQECRKQLLQYGRRTGETIRGWVGERYAALATKQEAKADGSRNGDRRTGRDHVATQSNQQLVH